MLKAFAQFIAKHKLAYFIGGLLAILSGLLGIVPNYMIQLFVDTIVNQQLTVQLLGKLLLLFILTALFIYIVDVMWLIILFGKSALFTKEIRQTLFRRLTYLKMPFYEKYRSGDLITRMTSDVDALGDTLAYGFLILVSDGTWMVSVLTVMFIMISWKLTLISIVPLLIFGVLVYFLGMEVDRRYEKSRDAVAQLSNEVLEVVEGVRVMRAYGKKELEQVHFQKRTREVMEKFNRMTHLNGLWGPLANVFTGLSTALGLGLGAYYVDKGQISIGQLISFQIYLGMLNGAIWGMADLVAIYQQGKVSYRKIAELRDADDQVEESGSLMIRNIEEIEFNNYEFSYPAATCPVVKGLTFKLKAGQTLGIVGKTGAGKSTLIRQLLRQYPVKDPNSIKINGIPITEYDRKSLARLIGYVPQDHVLFSRSVRDNILFGKEEALEEDLAQAIETADFNKDIDRMAKGLETLIGEKGVAISGGQKQRVSMARALIREPELLILDDSLSAVDAKTERAIIKNIQSARTGKTNIIITHRLSAIAHADQVLVLDKGQIIERGTPQELLKTQGWYYEQYISQQIEEGV
ncbi:ABC transporter ATP-binding protein [Facklamia sp. DSM 111018]|uniref:ABC transporter ATP-binding protein n=1 Tax=Facklamia lactis TaxID=2749967 RepID=A0ABS0LN15_9LACT|nr:ABC transporter ATP-binding protein [Facklamia lactis]MBG9979769.1 ABC transporter ATP-binding protein [Facklamia lactis]MBG9985551.1 ABC transporter ATP-binding protein [Facklamia lactis]